MKPFNVAIAGLGTVGGGAVALLQKNAALIEKRAQRPVRIVALSARDKTKDRGLDLSGIAWVDDPCALAQREDVDVVCELIGGTDGKAAELCTATLTAGKALVTANKALLAARGGALAALAQKHGGALMFEAAVAGGIPAIKVVRESLAGNSLSCVQGILNGTCNYILTRMEAEGLDFEPVLRDAQKLGYAEADPSADIDGHDTAHKLAVLSALAFGCPPEASRPVVEGIRRLTQADIRYARELGFRIKLLGVARYDVAQGLEQWVAPCLVPVEAALAKVDGVLNAVQLEGDAVGPLALIGRGAGAMATASSVVGDLVDLARGIRPQPWGQAVDGLSALPPKDETAEGASWYIRLQVADKVGVLADIASILRDRAISIATILQRGEAAPEGGVVPVIIVTHHAPKAAITEAVAGLAALPDSGERPLCLRIEG
ncbi:MAG: homoserine dehydrogenase [Alphaproteobacteria bacterium]|nr:homoserine dehydrogenase [Alphaproteobacteria bacterium]